jgi:DNA end-binding protein Ku
MTTMRSIKNTSVSFGLVNVPGKLYKAVDSHDVAFHQHHAGCGGSIKMERYCAGCEAKGIDFADIVKGVEKDDKTVLVTADEIKSLEGEVSPSIEVVQFVESSEIDAVAYETAYYFAPDKTSGKGYALLRAALTKTGKVGLVQFALRGRLSLGVLRVSGDVLVIHTIAWPDEVREPAFPMFDKGVVLEPALVDAATALVDSMTGTFKPEDFVDTYTGRVNEFITARAEGGVFVPAAKADDNEDVADLLAALTASVAKKKATKKAA